MLPKKCNVVPAYLWTTTKNWGINFKKRSQECAVSWNQIEWQKVEKKFNNSAFVDVIQPFRSDHSLEWVLIYFSNITKYFSFAKSKCNGVDA